MDHAGMTEGSVELQPWKLIGTVTPGCHGDSDVVREFHTMAEFKAWEDRVILVHGPTLEYSPVKYVEGYGYVPCSRNEAQYWQYTLTYQARPMTFDERVDMTQGVRDDD